MGSHKNYAKQGLLVLAVACLLIAFVGGMVLKVLSDTLTKYLLGGSVGLGFFVVFINFLFTSKYVSWEALIAAIVAMHGELFLVYRDIMSHLFEILSRLPSK